MIRGGFSIPGRVMNPPTFNGTTLLDLVKWISGWVSSWSEVSERLATERDKRYEERYQEQNRAITKAEAAQAQYNTTHNNLLSDNHKQAEEINRRFDLVLNVQEANLRFDSQSKEIADLKLEVQALRDYRSSGEGATATRKDSQSHTQWLIGLLIASGLALAGFAVALSQLAIRLLAKP